jgi:hypothetical protein
VNLPGFSSTSQPRSTRRFSRARAPSTREANALSQPNTTAARRAPSPSDPASAAAAINAWYSTPGDASDDSRPILERLGFTALCTTTPYVYEP